MNTRTHPFRLLFIGSRAVSGEDRYFPALEAALAGGADAFLLREKEMTGRELFEWASRARALTAAAGALLLVSERFDVALAAGADGVHLPERSFSPAEVRAAAGDRLIVGRSVHHHGGAAEAAAGGADYLMAGPVFETVGKGPPCGLGGLREVCEAAGELPVAAVGGIDAGRAAVMRGEGIGMVAVIRAIAGADDPSSAARAIREAMEG